MVFCAAVSHCFQWSRGRRAALGLDAGFGLKHQAPNLKLQSAQAQASVVLLQGTKRQAKSAIGAGLGWRILGAVRRALVARAAAKTAATIHAISASSRTNRVRHIPAGISSIPIAAPFPNTTFHVIKSPSVWLFLCDQTRAAGSSGNLKTSADVAVWTVGLIPGNVVQHRRAVALDNQRLGVSGVCRAGAAGVFPLRLGGKIVFITFRQTPGGAFALIQPAAKLRRIIPTDEIHRQVIVLIGEVFAGVGITRESHEVTHGLLFAAEVMERVVVEHLA